MTDDDDLPALTPVQIAAFRREAATLRDEDYSPEDMTAIRRGWLALTKERAFSRPGWHYEQPPINGVQRGSFRIPRNIVDKLGQGDTRAGAAVLAGMFSVAPGDDPTIVHPDVVRDIGHGSERAGRAVLDKFVARVRRQSRDGVVLEHDGLPHDDGFHGWSVRR
jgi:hypothetical protein